MLFFSVIFTLFQRTEAKVLLRNHLRDNFLEGPFFKALRSRVIHLESTSYQQSATVSCFGSAVKHVCFNGKNMH